MKNILFVIDKIELKYFEFNDLVTNFSSYASSWGSSYTWSAEP